jgi:hypothetical protein
MEIQITNRLQFSQGCKRLVLCCAMAAVRVDLQGLAAAKAGAPLQLPDYGFSAGDQGHLITLTRSRPGAGTQSYASYRFLQVRLRTCRSWHCMRPGAQNRARFAAGGLRRTGQPIRLQRSKGRRLDCRFRPCAVPSPPPLNARPPYSAQSGIGPLLPPQDSPGPPQQVAVHCTCL